MTTHLRRCRLWTKIQCEENACILKIAYFFLSHLSRSRSWRHIKLRNNFPHGKRLCVSCTLSYPEAQQHTDWALWRKVCFWGCMLKLTLCRLKRILKACWATQFSSPTWNSINCMLSISLFVFLTEHSWSCHWQRGPVGFAFVGKLLLLLGLCALLNKFIVLLVSVMSEGTWPGCIWVLLRHIQ